MEIAIRLPFNSSVPSSMQLHVKFPRGNCTACYVCGHFLDKANDYHQCLRDRNSHCVRCGELGLGKCGCDGRFHFHWTHNKRTKEATGSRTYCIAKAALYLPNIFASVSNDCTQPSKSLPSNRPNVRSSVSLQVRGGNHVEIPHSSDPISHDTSLYLPAKS